MMKINTGNVFDILSRLRIYFQANKSFQTTINEEPFRSELFNAEQMERHAEILASSHKLLAKNRADKLLKRLDDNEHILLEVRNLLVENIREGKAITPAAEWLLDNFYLMEEQVIIARKHLPKGYSEALPYLSNGMSAGMPRVYDIVLDIISHSDGRVDLKSLSDFVAAYQNVTTLTLGELWAIPIMLRLAVIENLRRVAGKIALDMIDHNLADYWADKMLVILKEEPGNLILTIADMARSNPVLDSPFVAGFTRKLQGKGPSMALPLSWMEQQLSAIGINSSELILQENQRQAANQVSVRNSIGTLRFLGATDWREFVETLSSVEQVLRRDMTGIYPLMDFATRDRYRHVVEAIAKESSLSETEVAQIAITLSQSHTDTNGTAIKRQHVGFYLIDAGRYKTEQMAATRNTFIKKIVRFSARISVHLYLLAIIATALITATTITHFANIHGVQGSMLFVVFALAIACAAQFAVSLVNWLSAVSIPPNILPRMDFSLGIPATCRSLVIIPTMLSGRYYVAELLEALEVRFLANREQNLHFGLLTDFTDAKLQSMQDDDELLHQVSNGIKKLNEKYQHPEYDIFFLFHRPRTYNEREQHWMGYERKRGKLSALNALIRGNKTDDFSLITGDYSVLSQVKYIITLDSDTQLPRDAARKFVATMAHPLNKAVYNSKKKRVTEGYGILQPRVASAIPTSASTWYLNLQGSDAGIDPYTQVSSDVYQDIFKEGSFIGKGIYDVDIFEQALAEVFEENRILSHDLLEGCYLRSGLLSDVLLYEESPSQYRADIKRHHRWIRGDWQIGAWALPFVTTSKGKLTLNKLSTLSKWKIFDNLRRSLLPLSLLLILLLGWTILPYPWFWTAIVTITMLLPVMTAVTWQLVHKPRDLTLNAHFIEVNISLRSGLFRFMFNLAVLPYEALINTDAIIRTNWRMIVTRRKLLEWAPSASNNKRTDNHLVSVFKDMWIAPFLGLYLLSYFLLTYQESLWVSAPILVLWLLAPMIVWRLSKQRKEHSPRLSPSEILFLNKTARKTWAFFEQFITPTDNWLPPDNFQEQPVPIIAHRTSPTNMGLALLANLSAYDFGYIPAGVLATRCLNSLQTMLTLERYKGHFYNWYDTVSLASLKPKYVSTVDSGNLLGHMLTLRQGIVAIPAEPVFSKKAFEGLRTTLGIIRDTEDEGTHSLILAIIALLDTAIQGEDNLVNARNLLDDLVVKCEELAGRTNVDTLSYKWADRLLNQTNAFRDELMQLIPWLGLLPVPPALIKLQLLEQIPSLSALQGMHEIIAEHFILYSQQTNSTDEDQWLSQLQTATADLINTANNRITQFSQIAEICEQLSVVEYDFLYDKSTRLLRIGYNVDEHKKDNSFYDLLASEARLGIFVAIAQGKLPQESWFALGRLLTNAGGDPILLSWSGSMFEYLMPQLIMPSYENTLLQQTSMATVKRQIDYAVQRNIPWGISESAYNMIDANLNYQYRAFGVPGLGLKRGLEEDLVVAPYATMLALMVMPVKACNNLQLLSDKGFEGEFGFFEAIDYTTSRIPRGSEFSIIPSYMVHHQGMGLLSLAYLLQGKPMQRRFISDLSFQATLLLLQERLPRTTLFYAHTADLIETHPTIEEMPVRKVSTPNTPMPEIDLLSNGRYHVMVTNSGGGYSRWKDIAVTRWREDATKDDKGIFCYIKDVATGNFWSNTYQPTSQPTANYEAVFSLGRIEFKRKDFGIETLTEIVVSPEDDVEIRRVRITNRTQSTRILEITSYSEVVLASQSSDESHPAFSNLFVETELQPDHRAILATRRPRSEDEIPPWMFHLMDGHGAAIEDVSYETDRMEFIGRGNDLTHPQSMEQDQLSGNEGAVLDPIMSIRYRISIRPNHTATFDLIYGISETKASCEALMHKYGDRHLKNRAFELSWTHSQLLMRQINITDTDAQLYGRLAASLIFSNPHMRAPATVMQNNFRGQSGLWSHSISGDLPIVLLHVYDSESMELVRQLVEAHAYWRLKGLEVDLVIWNEDHGTYRQLLQDHILSLITSETVSNTSYLKPGNIFVKTADQLSVEDRILFESIAHVILYNNKGTLAEQVNRHFIDRALPAVLAIQAETESESESESESEMQHTISLPSDLMFFNGIGGFTANGKEYKIIIDKRATTPAPWSNVIANPSFGTVVSESGSAYTWAINAHEYRITPWSNDPVSDTGGEAFYLRDEETGNFWSPSLYPASGTSPYIVTHGYGYSVFEHSEYGISSEMTVFVDKDLPIKFIVLKVKNNSGRERVLTTTGFLEIIMGDVRSKTNMHILSEQDLESGALLFRNRYNQTHSARVTFFNSSGKEKAYTTDRSEFIGRNGNLASPQAMYRKKLSGMHGAGIDPCAALQVKFNLLAGAEKEIIFQVGNGENLAEVTALISKFADPKAAISSLTEMKLYWQNIVQGVQVATPDKALDIITNGWLTYQTIASRIFARSGFYQSGGAFGFRDQLQDVLSLLHTQPGLARQQILLNASRQFLQGDVQHWWHPPEGRGVRTRCTDDLLWLPFAVSKYLIATGDKEILDISVGFLETRLLHPEEDSLYDLPVSGNLNGTIYEHCVLAIKRSLQYGVHGLPLIGSGDWNDGMDKVGNKGFGESVWLAFFLYDVLSCFAETAVAYGDDSFAEFCKSEALSLQAKIETSGWDGQWYLRAYFDDGTPLGARENAECSIDAIAQSWAVLSQAADNRRAIIAMASLDKYLVKREMKIIQLLDPPFNTSALNPGYIKGYVPGIRENGGQYSHAAIWALMAFAKLGDREKTWELFNMILPLNHADCKSAVDRYKVEPYVMAADVYANDRHKGRGGWTWYTGSSGWMYQFITGSILGIQLRNGTLKFEPCFPIDWPFVTINYRYKSTLYKIRVFQLTDNTPSHWIIAGETEEGDTIELKDDLLEHVIDMYINIAKDRPHSPTKLQTL